jgi:hypothetical protein
LTRHIGKKERHHAHAAAHIPPGAGETAQAARRMMEADGCRARIERARVRSDDALSHVGALQALILQIALHELGHRPMKYEITNFLIVSNALF